MPGQPVRRALDKREDAGRAFVGQHLDVGQARGIVHAYVGPLPAGAPDGIPAIAGQAMPGLEDAAVPAAPAGLRCAGLGA